MAEPPDRHRARQGCAGRRGVPRLGRHAVGAGLQPCPTYTENRV
jgi:hypothetical protein